MIQVNTSLTVRYEELSLHPEREAKRIYDFVGLDFTDEMKQWIRKNTKSKSIYTSSDAYSTERNSKSSIEKWRKELTFEQVQVIQEHCRDAMRYLKYKEINSRQQLLNLNVSLYD